MGSTPVLPLLHAPQTPLPCPGHSYAWGIPDPSLSYPYAIHHPSNRFNPGYEILSVDDSLSTIAVRAPACTGIASNTSGSCAPCQSIDDLVLRVENHAKAQDFRGMQVSSLSHLQMVKKVESLERARTKLRLKNLDACEALKAARSRDQTCRSILRVVSRKHVPAVHRIFRNAGAQHWGPKKLLQKLVAAAKGEYEAKNFSNMERKLAMVVYLYGGAGALHALHKSPFRFPSRNTIIDIKQETKLRVTSGEPTMTDILANIETMFGDTPADIEKVGITMSMDEIAVDDRLCYLPETDEIVGLCEHAQTELPSLKMGKSLDTVYKVKDATNQKKAEVVKESLVISFNRNSATGYGARAVGIHPTCKEGGFRRSAKLMEMYRQGWKISPVGEKLNGPLIDMSSDGDPRRRAAFYLHCMVLKLTSAHPLYKHVGDLIGLNLWTGPDGETQDFDYRHIFKRLCKLLCSTKGMLVAGVIINKNILATWLERLTHVDWSETTLFALLEPDWDAIGERIHTLLSPKDAQDVPRAIKLLRLTSDLRNLDSEDLNPSETSTHRALSLLGEMLSALLEPFINTAFTLTEQITSLIVAAHIACALYCEHEGDFMPQALYCDFQNMFRSAIFRVAHAKNLDPEQIVLLCLLGDDVLEILFGRVRMIGGHKSNVTCEELREHITSAICLDKIFDEFPDWERVARRLNLERASHLDHLSPRHWKSELRASSCDLKQCWTLAVARSEAILRKYGIIFDFNARFENWQESGVDLMRPKGGKFVGISAEVDRSVVDEVNAEDTMEVDIDSNAEMLAFRSFDGLKALEEEKARAAATNGSPHSVWMELDNGKVAHKKAILRLRQGYGTIPADNEFRLGSIYAALVCIGSSNPRVCVAILTCTCIKSGTHLIDRAPIDEISQSKSTFQISGQVLCLAPHSTASSGSDQGMEAVDPLVDGWFWTSKFISFDATKAKANQPTATRLKHLSITTNGQLVRPLLKNEVESVAISELTNEDTPGGLEHTWYIRESTLSLVESALYDRLQGEDDTLRNLVPMFDRVREVSVGFSFNVLMCGIAPLALVVHCGLNMPLPSAGSARLLCSICHKMCLGAERQNHMGEHILRMYRGVQEPKTAFSSISQDYPCGFCGTSTVNGACEIRVEGGKAISKCPQAYNFLIKAALKISQSKPCTNVPMKCNFCDETHWKYNIRRHLSARHPSWNEQTGKGVDELVKNMLITELEEVQMGIPPERLGSMAVMNTLIADDRKSRIPLSIRDKHGDSPRRDRTLPSMDTRHIPIPFALQGRHPPGVPQSSDSIFN
ncbi:hypothetical protein BKA70DRAFT_1089861 [Coprinopsis sp. MPI-PUGE-AT-0042]|nr:hypothetical protein BKA70DRAFT_1089861 [Coprinopsis sp. MPI-PUGE-AT-0042]